MANAMGRRAALAAVPMLAGAALLTEWASLRGAFDHRHDTHLPDKNAQNPQWQALLKELEQHRPDTAGIVHIGHSTHLLILGGQRWLTDPWFYDPAFGALSHAKKLPVTPEAIGRLDGILISHDHPDHADPRALDRLQKTALVVVGDPRLLPKLKQLGFQATAHLDEWGSLTHGAVTITATPAIHDVQEQGFCLAASERTLYFAGDTRFTPAFHEIAERFHLDLAILPVDGTRVAGAARWVMDPKDAAHAVAILKPNVVLASHAEARVSDPLADWALVQVIPDAARQFATLAPGVRHIIAPAAGHWLRL